jgi:hypothetical protein
VAVGKELKLHLSDDNTIVVADSSGGIKLTSRTSSGITIQAGAASITISDSGIVLDNGKGSKLELSGAEIKVTGPAGVDLNNGGLKVI